MGERRYLYEELAEEVGANYASIVVAAWSMILNAESRKLSTPKIKSLKTEVAGMEKAAILVINNHEYLEPGLTPEQRLKRDKERYREAYEKDAADTDL
ncbi:hypothetical protein ACFC1L_39905 [Streptomyces sp. NPDC056210]|uniref:hypothetical protein n=1 Tax=Streptomyces sp. NPDC056210 TaxID=3345746 RepID=UPI0035D67484